MGFLIDTVPRNKRHVLIGTLVGAKELIGFEFDQAMPYGGCRICGKLWQPPILRDNQVPYDRRVLIVKRWRQYHALNEHNEEEHKALALSGLWATPEAQVRLAPYGITDVTSYSPTDSAMLDSALLEAPATPVNDADGMTRKERQNMDTLL